MHGGARHSRSGESSLRNGWLQAKRWESSDLLSVASVAPPPRRDDGLGSNKGRSCGDFLQHLFDQRVRRLLSGYNRLGGTCSPEGIVVFDCFHKSDA